MFYVDKKASAAHLGECSQIMDKIVAENPSYWPYGCNPDMFNGGVYLIRKSASHEPVGFTGWQEFQEDGKKIGYYSIGILPEYRQQGFAKEAVAKLINEKSASVDEVRALVMKHNKPSLELAKALNVNTLVKNARGGKFVGSALSKLLGGTSAAGFMDWFMHDGDYSNFSKTRAANALANLGLGYLGSGQLMAKTKGSTEKGIGLLLGMANKDLVLGAAGALPKLDKLLQKEIQKGPAPAPSIVLPPAPAPSAETPILDKKDKLLLAGLLGAGVLGITGAGLGIARSLSKAQAKRDAGRIQLRLPTRDKNDQETIVDVPLDQANLPPALVSKVMRDTRRKLREETEARTLRRKTKSNLNPFGAINLEDEEDALEKAAFAYYKTKCKIKTAFVQNKNALKPTAVVNTMEKNPAEVEAQQQAQQANSAQNDESSELMTNLADEQKKLIQANEELQKRLASIEHTNSLNQESLKNVSARTSAIANNLKIAGLIKLSQEKTSPFGYIKTHEELMQEDVPAAWEWAKATGPSAFQATFLRPENDWQKELQQNWNKDYIQNPEYLSDVIANLGTEGKYTAIKGLHSVAEGIRAPFRRAMHGWQQANQALQVPLQENETWYNPSVQRLKALIGSASNVVGGSALAGTAVGGRPVVGLASRAVSDYVNPEAERSTKGLPTGGNQALSVGNMTPNEFNSVAYYGFGPSTPQQNFYESLGLDRRRLGLIESLLLNQATSPGGGVLGNFVKNIFGAGGNTNNSPASPGLTSEQISRMYTPVQSMQ